MRCKFPLCLCLCLCLCLLEEVFGLLPLAVGRTRTTCLITRARLDSNDFAIQREVQGDNNLQGLRVDAFLAAHAADLFPTATSAKKTVRKGLCRINGRVAEITDVVSAIDRVVTYVRCRQSQISAGDESEFQHEDIRVLFEDDFLAIIDKPQGMDVFPPRLESSVESPLAGRSVHSRLLKRLAAPGVGTPSPLNRPQPVHRLDRDTGGLLLIAKTRPSLIALSQLFSARNITKRYMAICYGKFAEPTGSVTTPLGGQEARTDYEVQSEVKTPSGATLTVLSITLFTGRTHQIRRHLDLLGHPVIADKDYWMNEGGRVSRATENNANESEIFCGDKCLPHHCLWSAHLSFAHPNPNSLVGNTVEVTLDVTVKLQDVLSRLRSM